MQHRLLLLRLDGHVPLTWLQTSQGSRGATRPLPRDAAKLAAITKASNGLSSRRL